MNAGFRSRISVLRIFLLLPVILLGMQHPLIAQQDYQVHDIQISGNQHFSQDELQQQMVLQGTGFLKRNLLRKDPVLFSQELLQGDIGSLVIFYQTEGFLQVEIPAPELEVNHEKQTVDIHISIDEGPPVRIKELKLKFPPSLSDQEQEKQVYANLMEKLELQTGKRFRDNDLIRDRNSLLQGFTYAGYPYVEVDFKLIVDVDSAHTDLIWEITPGPRCTFGAITISGNNQTKTSFIRKQLTFHKGAPFNQKQLDETQRRLFSLGLFQVAIVKAQFSAEQDSIIPVRVTISEAARWTGKVGVGYGREDKFRAFTQGRRIGFLGGARRLELLLKHSGLEPYNIDLKMIEPLFFSYKTALTLNPYLRRETEPGYSVTRTGGRMSLLYQITLNLKGSLTFIREIVNQDSSGIDPAQVREQETDDLYDKAGPIIALTWDNSQPIFSPDRGYFILASTKLNGYPRQADFPFIRYLLDARHYRRQAGIIVAYRVKIGLINSYDELEFVPVEERFYAGGSGSVRGWGRQKLGPQDPNGNPIGGNSLLEGSIELRFSLWHKFVGVTFLDFGNVWLESGNYPLKELRYALGFGFGVDTPIGPLRLDLARPLQDEKKSWEFHLNIGKTF
jgi:outer membrane protein insertion porin family